MKWKLLRINVLGVVSVVAVVIVVIVVIVVVVVVVVAVVAVVVVVIVVVVVSVVVVVGVSDQITQTIVDSQCFTQTPSNVRFVTTSYHRSTTFEQSQTAFKPPRTAIRYLHRQIRRVRPQR